MKLKTLLKVLDKGCKVDVYKTYGAFVTKANVQYDEDNKVKKIYVEDDVIHIEVEW